MQLLSTIKAQWTSKIRHTYTVPSWILPWKLSLCPGWHVVAEYRVRGAVAFCSNEINPITNPVILVWQTMFSQDCLYLVSFNVLTVFVFFISSHPSQEQPERKSTVLAHSNWLILASSFLANKHNGKSCRRRVSLYVVRLWVTEVTEDYSRDA